MSGEEEWIMARSQNRVKKGEVEPAEIGIGTICTSRKLGNLLGAGHFTEARGRGTHQPGHCSGFVAALDQSWSCGEVLQ